LQQLRHISEEKPFFQLDNDVSSSFALYSRNQLIICASNLQQMRHLIRHKPACRGCGDWTYFVVVDKHIPKQLHDLQGICIYVCRFIWMVVGKPLPG